VGVLTGGYYFQGWLWSCVEVFWKGAADFWKCIGTVTTPSSSYARIMCIETQLLIMECLPEAYADTSAQCPKRDGGYFFELYVRVLILDD
jgi:hypothetical protein